jgi:hypothetical protein
LAYVDPVAATTEHWLQAGIGPRDAVTKLQLACSDVELSEKTIQGLEAHWRQHGDAFRIVLANLAGARRLAGFDCEDVESPADHTRMVHYLAEIAANKLTIDDVVQTTEPNGDVRLLLTHRADSYSFTVAGNGSWRNVPGTLDGLNQILDRLGVPERFIELDLGGQGPGAVAFVRPDMFLPAARELGICLGSEL